MKDPIVAEIIKLHEALAAISELDEEHLASGLILVTLSSRVAHDAGSAVPKDELGRLLDWGREQLILVRMLAGFLRGSISIHFPADAQAPLFSLTEQGRQEGARLASEGGASR